MVWVPPRYSASQSLNYNVMVPLEWYNIQTLIRKSNLFETHQSTGKKKPADLLWGTGGKEEESETEYVYVWEEME